jgi:hypothetical protein
MAIEKTRSVQRVEVFPAVDENDNPRLMVVYLTSFDDPNDDELPVNSHHSKHLTRYYLDENQAEQATDISGEDQLIQDICNALWV